MNKVVVSVRPGATLVELLIVIAIITLLLQLALPAVEMSREAARRTQCGNNLRQIGVAILSHESSLKHFPTGGWGDRYVGDPDRGTGRGQPGGWIYNTLPFLEETPIHDLGKGLNGEEKFAATAQMLETPVAVFNCPSRRSPQAYPLFQELTKYVNYRAPQKAAKSDYAGNGGDLFGEDTRHNGGPPSYDQADQEGDGTRKYWMDTSVLTGVFYQRSTTRASDVTDGLSKTYFAGEKFVNAEFYTDMNTEGGDDQGMYLGADEDILRYAGHFDGRNMVPRRDEPHTVHNEGFGGPHPSGCMFLFGDGSVRLMGFDLDASIHRQQANRHDEQVQLSN